MNVCQATFRPLNANARIVLRRIPCLRNNSQPGGKASSAVSWRGRNTFRFMSQSASDVADKRTNPGQTAPNCWRKNPSNNGGKKPPKPPSAPTNPPTVPVSLGKNCGTSLKTAPLPRPSRAAQPTAPTVNGNIAGQASSSANNPMPGNFSYEFLSFFDVFDGGF